MLGLGIEETTATTGTGTLTLSAVSQRARIANIFGINDPVAYVAISGNGDLEWGVGRAAAGNTLVRPTTILASIVSNTYSEGGGPISLSGTSTIRVVEHSGATASCSPAVRTPAAAAYYNPVSPASNAGGTLALVANRTFAVPIRAPEFPTLTGVGLVVTTAVAGTCYLGIAENYINSSGQMQPGRLLGNGSVSTGTTGIKTDTASYAPKLRPGHLYWQLIQGSAAATIRAFSGTASLNILGFSSSDGITPYQALYVDQASAPYGGLSDLSGVSFSISSSLSGTPHMFLTS